jgi:glycosyltransferase involved in cell wall biosynthesis
MENNKTISVILPIKSAKTGFFEDYFKKAIESLKLQKSPVDELIIVHTKETLLETHLKDFDFGDLNVRFLEWTTEPNFAEQINAGVKEAKSEWVSFFEFDDEYSNIWFKNVKEYMDFYPTTSAFLPIVVDVDENGIFKGFTNEATFAANISEEMGILVNDTLQAYQNFQFSGQVIKKDVYLKFGALKSNLKLTFGYEYFLRLTNNGIKFLTIPKIGYKHTNLRNGSIFWQYKNDEDYRLTDDEVRFWVENAKKEYLFINQREINYEPQEV